MKKVAKALLVLMAPSLLLACGTTPAASSTPTSSTGTSSAPSTSVAGSSTQDSSGTSVASSSTISGEGTLADGLVSNGPTAKTATEAVADPRVEAYKAYSSDGTEIGGYKTIASAVGAAVAADVAANTGVAEASQVYGSYVTKKDEDFKYFKNKKGFADGNDDQFWYYENGNTLAAYNCYDQGDMAGLRNTKLITDNVSQYGTSARQFWNSYGLYDAAGAEMNGDVYAQTWELSSTMDAAALCLTGRLKGITGLKYSVDLSNVKIAPAYEDCDSTYAFMGFYAWQDYYVVAIGIACDTATGNWYQFAGTSRDDSFSDVKYNLGACVMTSTYNQDGGYFVPDNSSLTMSINTKREYDSAADEYYQVDEEKIEIADGATFVRDIDNSVLNNFFSGTTLGYENAYAFIAGLDIKNDTVANNLVGPTDYFNGSYFTGLAVTDAQAYFPTVDEMSDVVYGYPIDTTLRGKWHNVMMAGSTHDEGVYDYTILNTNCYSSYSAVDGHDVYDFKYDGNPVTTEKLGTEAKTYQDKIDSLDAMTGEQIAADTTTFDLVATWAADNSTAIAQKYRLILNFDAYYRAVDKVIVATASDAAKAVITSIKALDVIDFSGFGTIYEGTYAALSADEKKAVELGVGKQSFADRLSLYTFVKNLPATAADASVYTTFIYVGGSSDALIPGKTTLKVNEAYAELLRVLSLILKGTTWGGTDYPDYNDDANSGGVKVMNFDNNFWPSMRVVQLIKYFKGLTLDLPTYVQTMLSTADYATFGGCVDAIYGTTALALRIQSASLTTVASLTADEKAFLNTVWVSGYSFPDGGITWNWESGNQFEDYCSERTRGITVLAGGDGTTKTKNYVKVVADFLAANGYTVKDSGWGVTADTIA
jgi:hypothetical protein